MKMLKTRKKWISLLVTLTFLLTLFPMALPAFASNYSRLGSVAAVDDDGVYELNTVKCVFSPGELNAGDEVTLRLPTDFEFRDSSNTDNVMSTPWLGKEVSSSLYIYGDENGNRIATLTGADEGFYGGPQAASNVNVGDIDNATNPAQATIHGETYAVNNNRIYDGNDVIGSTATSGKVTIHGNTHDVITIGSDDFIAGDRLGEKNGNNVLDDNGFTIGSLNAGNDKADIDGKIHDIVPVSSDGDDIYINIGKVDATNDKVNFDGKEYVLVSNDVFDILGTVDAANNKVEFKDKTYELSGTDILEKSGGSAEGDLEVTMLDDNEIKIRVNKDLSLSDDATMFVYLENIYVDDGYDGDIELAFNAPSGSGFDSGSIVVGRVTGGEVTVEVIDSANFSDEGEVKIRLKEDRVGAFDVDKKSVKLVLPDGFVWKNANAKLIIGDLAAGEFDVDVEDEDLLLEIKTNNSKKANTIEIDATIVVDDETRAKLGDVKAKVKGESSSTPSEIVVGRYGEYDVTVEAKGDAKTVYAGKLEQELQKLVVKESVSNSLIEGRTITLTLPEWAKWYDLKDNPSHKGCELKLESFPGKDGRVAKFKVEKNSGKDASEIEIKDLEVALSPDAPEGDLIVEVGGTAGAKGDVKLGEVKKPVDVTVSETPTLVIGRADQTIGEITITEAEEGLLEKNENLVLELPKDIEWDDYDVEVTEGDLRIDRVKADYQYLNIKIDKESNDPSTIKVTGTVTAYRTVPEGRVEVEIGGRALIEVNDTIKVFKDKKDDLEIGLVPAIEYKKYDNGLWEKENYVLKATVANVGTPAPGDLKATAVFTVGSTEYTIDGVAKTMDAAPYIKDSRTFLPVRYVGEAVGVAEDKVLWDDAAKTATFIKGDRIAQVTIGSKEMLVNGAKVTMDVAPEINNGRTMMPIRWIGIAFDAELDWDNEAKTVTIN